MLDLDWGPFPKLAASLKLDPREIPLAWLDRIAQTGCPWQHLARAADSDFWPACMPGDSPAALPQLPFWMRLRARTPIRVNSEGVARFIPSCHAWLATENTRFLASWLAPDPSACPPWVGHTSSQALVWSLIAYAAYCVGPAVIEERPDLLEASLLDEHAAPGDLLSLHRDVERLAAFWLEQTARQGAKLPSGSRAGGVRTKGFLRALTAIPSSHKSALLALASCSPLTRLAYLDIFTDYPNPRVFASLCRILATDNHRSESWLALLANTLLGALLSTPLDLDAWKLATTKLRSLEAEAAQWGFFTRLFGSGQLVKARTQVQRLRVQMHDTLLARLEAWHTVAREVSAKELHSITLDRLSRIAAARATPAMRIEWRHVCQRNSLPYAGVELFRPESAYNAELSKMLLALPLDELRQLLTTPEQGRLSEMLEDILTFPAPCDVPVPRFLDDRAGVRLPFQPPNHRGPSPATIFSELLVALLKVLPQAQIEAAGQEETAHGYAAG